MATKPLPSQEVLRQLLDYNPDTGALTWRERGPEWFTAKSPARRASLCRLWNQRYAGTPAFTCISEGYMTGSVNKANYKAHRVAWKLTHGTDPDQIDHINGVRTDNRLENLRDVTLAENTRNRRRPTNNKSGMIGVHRWAHDGIVYWVATSPRKAQSTYHHCIGQAIKARRVAEIECGFHENHGRP